MIPMISGPRKVMLLYPTNSSCTVSLKLIISSSVPSRNVSKVALNEIVPTEPEHVIQFDIVSMVVAPVKSSMPKGSMEAIIHLNKSTTMS